MITAAARNLYLNSDSETHAPSEADPTKPACGTRPKPGASFRPTLQRVTCQKCGATKYRLDEFVSWDGAAVVATVEDSGDSVTVRTALRDMPGVELELDLRIRPEDLDRFIARLVEIKEARGL
jgi:hypothetical protein